jgi:ribosomal protein S18 acetylase RimI-like enzyme
VPLTVRRATPADVAVVVEFNRLLARESEGKALDPAVLTPGVAAALADPHKGFYFLAEQDGRAVGQMMFTYEWSDWRNGWFWWLQSVYVEADARRQGIFHLLCGHVQELARQDPTVIGVRLYVEIDNDVAQAVYRGHGLAPTTYVVMEQYPL